MPKRNAKRNAKRRPEEGIHLPELDRFYRKIRAEIVDVLNVKGAAEGRQKAAVCMLTIVILRGFLAETESRERPASVDRLSGALDACMGELFGLTDLYKVIAAMSEGREPEIPFGWKM